MNNNIFLKMYYFSANVFLAYILRRPLILCFHRVIFKSNNLLDQRVGFTTPRNFKKVLRFMSILGYEFVPLEKLAGSIEHPRFKKKVAAITFDDGFKDLYQNAYPIIKELNVPFTLFLTTSLIDSNELLWLHKLYISLDRLPLEKRALILNEYIGSNDHIDDLSVFIGKLIHSKTKNDLRHLAAVASSAARINNENEEHTARDLYLSKEEIEEMKNHGLKVETHGHEHWPLTNLDEKETQEEIKSSIRFIEDKLDSSPKYYALPHGTSNKFIKDIVKTLGLKGVATIERKIIAEAPVDLYRLPRICVYDDVLDFYRVLNKNYLKYIHLKIKATIKAYA